MRLLYLTAVAVAAAPLQAQGPTEIFDTVSQQQPEVDQTTQAHDVAFRRDINQRMTVPVHLSGTGPFRFLVDTGADRTAISRALAARLGLAMGEAASLHTMTGMSSVQTATVPDLRLNRSTLRIIDAPVLEAEHMGADGILGTDSLRSSRVLFDFENRTMTIVPAEHEVELDDDETIVVYGRLRSGRLIMTNALAENSRITVILDTGSEVSVGNEAFRKRMAKRGVLENSGPVELESVTGEKLMGEYTTLRELEMGEVTLRNLAIVFAEAHTFKQLDLENRPALLLGMNAFRAFKKVSIDFANKKLRVILPEHGSLEPFQLAHR